MSDSTKPNREGRRRRRPVGRPPAGARAGERVKDYPQLGVRVPTEVKARLSALSAITGRAQWRLLVDAVDCMLDDLSPTERQRVQGLSRQLLRPAS